MFQKKLILALFFPCFLAISCSSLDIQQNETDLWADRLEADGKDVKSATPIKDFFPDIFSDSYTSINNSITFEVALNKLSILPIITASKQDGIITTDWYSTTSNSAERVKFNIIIKDDNMTETSIQINMFKEILDGNIWKTEKIDSDTADKIKENILLTARKVKAAAELS
ncbi:DUF3576 domain-containing protein [Pelagibacterales bacterium]|nr:DUF3576 domain-containing protein [Pelagibacterales bacterium]